MADKAPGIVYQIVAHNSFYIGKLESKSYLWDHLNRAISGKRKFTGGDEDAAKWEAEWWASIKTTGLIKDTYIDYSRCYSIDGAVLYSQIENELNEIIQSANLGPAITGQQWLNAFQVRWGYPDKRSVAEAMMISITPHRLNTKIDNMSYQEYNAFCNGNITEATCQSKMDRILDDEKIGFHFFRTITWDQYINFSEELKKRFQDAFPAFKWRHSSTSDLFTFDLRKHPDLAEAITKVFTEKTLEEYVKDIKKYATEFHGNSNIRKKLNQLADQIAAQPYTSREEIVRDVNIFFKENKLKELTRDYKETRLLRKANLDVDVFCDIFNQWHKIKKEQFQDTTSQWTPCWTQAFLSLHNSYKNFFTSFIQDNLFEPHYDKDYETFRQAAWDIEEKHFNKTYQYYRAYKKSTDNLEISVGSFRDSLIAAVERLNFPFILANWNEIYTEQVSYWLNHKHSDALVITERENFEDLPSSITQEITIY